MIKNQSLETQGITKQSMDNETKDKEAFQRITTGALSVTPMKTPSTPRITQESIRAELFAHTASQLKEQIPSIQNLLLHLEDKGR
jgi:hypothetical protein